MLSVAYQSNRSNFDKTYKKHQQLSDPHAIQCFYFISFLFLSLFFRLSFFYAIIAWNLVSLLFVVYNLYLAQIGIDFYSDESEQKNKIKHFHSVIIYITDIKESTCVQLHRSAGLGAQAMGA